MAVIKVKRNGKWVEVPAYVQGRADVVQSTGTSTTSVMSQDAVTKELNQTNKNVTDVQKKAGAIDSSIEKLDNFVEGKVIFQSTNTYIKTLGTGGKVVETPVAFESFGSIILPCIAGDHFTVKAKGGNEGRAFAFVDAEGNNLLCAEAYQEVNKVVVAPANAVKLIVNNNFAALPHPYVLKKKVDEEVDILKGKVNEMEEVILDFGKTVITQTSIVTI